MSIAENYNANKTHINSWLLIWRVSLVIFQGKPVKFPYSTHLESFIVLYDYLTSLTPFLIIRSGLLVK